MPEPIPEWFGDVRADVPSAWARVRVSVEAMRQAWLRPTVGPALRATWAAFLATDEGFRERLPHADLGKLDPHQLLKVVHVAESLNAGIADCTRDAPDLSLGAKAKVYFLAVLFGGLANAHRLAIPVDATVRWAVGFAMRGAGCYAAAPAALEEIRRRGAQHAGYHAALVEILRRAEPWLPLFGYPEEIVDRLTRATREKTKQRSPDFLESLSGQAAETISKTWGDVEVLELLARAVDGDRDLNLAPLAIARDAANAARPRKLLKFTLSFDEIEDSPVGPRQRGGAPDGSAMTITPTAMTEWKCLPETMDPRGAKGK